MGQYMQGGTGAGEYLGMNMIGERPNAKNNAKKAMCSYNSG